MKLLAVLSLLAATAAAAAVPVDVDAAVDAPVDAPIEKRDTCPATKNICNNHVKIRDADCRCPNQVGPCALYACPGGHRQNCGTNKDRCFQTT